MARVNLNGENISPNIAGLSACLWQNRSSALCTAELTFEAVPSGPPSRQAVLLESGTAFLCPHQPSLIWAIAAVIICHRHHHCLLCVFALTASGELAAGGEYFTAIVINVNPLPKYRQRGPLLQWQYGMRQEMD